jgi:hypothetical protein
MIFKIKDNKLYNSQQQVIGTVSKNEIELYNDSLRHEVIKLARIYRGRDLNAGTAEQVREEAKKNVNIEAEQIQKLERQNSDYVQLVTTMQKYILKLNTEIEQLKK